MITKKPQPQILTIWRLSLAIITLVPAFLTSVVLRVYSTSWLVATAAWLLAFLLLYLVFFPLLYKSLSYTLFDDKLVLNTGAINRRVIAVPLAAIQFVSVFRSPLDRMFGLSSLTVVMAGGHVTLIGLTVLDAQSLVGLLKH